VPKQIVRHSYGLIKIPNLVHMCDLLFLSVDKYKGKKYIGTLNIIDVASRYKASYPIVSKKASEVSMGFRTIYRALTKVSERFFEVGLSIPVIVCVSFFTNSMIDCLFVYASVKKLRIYSK